MNAVEAILHRKQTGVFTPWKVGHGGLCSSIQRRVILVPAICYSPLYASNSRNYCFTEDGEKLRSRLQKEIIASQPVWKRYWNGVHHCLEVFGRVCREVVFSLTIQRLLPLFVINRLVSSVEGPGDRRNATVFEHEGSVVWSEGNLLLLMCSFVSVG